VDFLQAAYRSELTVCASHPSKIAKGGAAIVSLAMLRSSSLTPENFAELAVDVGGVLDGFGDEFDPLFPVRREFELTQQVGSLHDGFEGVAQVMNEFAHLVGGVGREFLRVGHDRSRVFSDCTSGMRV